MKLLLCFLFLTSGCCSLFAQDNLTIGQSLPKGDLRVKDVSGNLVTLNEIKAAGGLLVIFGANTCPYVIRNQARTQEVCTYATDNGIGVIMLNSNDANRSGGDSFAEMQRYAITQNYHWKYAVDSHSEIANAFGANRTPECFLFDSNLKLVYHGAIDDSPTDETQVTRKHLRQAISELLSGKDVSVKESRSVGCTIHRRR